MLDQADIGLLTAVLVVLGVFAALNARTLRSDAAKVQKYRLFAVRDTFIYLVAIGKLNEDEFLFRTIYKAVNMLLDRTNELSLRTFLAATREMQKKGLDPAEQNEFDRILNELKKRNDPELTQAVFEFFYSIYAITLENSLTVRMLEKIDATLSSPPPWIRRVASILPTSVAAYKLSQRYHRASSNLPHLPAAA